jgi:hypothetical protein
MGNGVWTEVRGNAYYDGIKEVAKLMLPFLAGLGTRQWFTDHSTALMWTAAFFVSGAIAFWDQMPKRRHVRSVIPHSGLRIESARWYCTIFPEANKAVTDTVQGKVVGGSLRLHAHDSVLGDVCELHAGRHGHPKTLELDLIYRSHVTATHDEVLSISCSAESKKESGVLLPARETQTPHTVSRPEHLPRISGFFYGVRFLVMA